MIYSTIAAAIFVVLLLLFFPGDREYQRIPYDVVFWETVSMDCAGMRPPLLPNCRRRQA